MEPAMTLLGCLAVLFLIVWFIECRGCVSSSAEQVRRPTPKPKTPEQLHDPVRRLQQPFETLEESYDFYRNLKSPDYNSLKQSDLAKLTKVQEANSKLKTLVKNQQHDIDVLKKRQAATKTRLAWFEEWYPKLHSAYNELTQDGTVPASELVKFRVYGEEGKKVFNQLKRQHEVMKTRRKRLLDQSKDEKFQANKAKRVAKDSRSELRNAEAEIERLQCKQKEWQVKKDALEASVEELPHLRSENKTLRENYGRPRAGSGSRVFDLPSVAETCGDISDDDWVRKYGMSSAGTSSDDDRRKEMADLGGDFSCLGWLPRESESDEESADEVREGGESYDFF